MTSSMDGNLWGDSRQYAGTAGAADWYQQWLDLILCAFPGAGCLYCTLYVQSKGINNF